MPIPDLSRPLARPAAALIGAILLLLIAGAVDPRLAKYEREQATVRERIVTFDNLDFDVFTHQKWDRLKESHSEDVLVHWPDGHTTRGLERHIQDLKAMFVYAPDTRIESHPVKPGTGPA